VLVGLCLLLQGDNIDDEQHAHLSFDDRSTIE